jgi:hypothetical protein
MFIKENLERESTKSKRRLMNVVRLPSKKPIRIQKLETIVSSAAMEEIVSGFPPIPGIDLKNKGGKTISDLSFANFYVGNSGSWNQNDIKSIDSALAESMSDKNLNNVMVQYFPGHDAITSTFKGSQVLSGKYPKKFFKDDVESLVNKLFSQKKLDNYDLNNTVFNFMLPSGTILNDGERNAGEEEEKTISTQRKSDSDDDQALIEDEEFDSLSGLGGFHGSIHGPGNNPITIYYAVGVYSENLPDGTTNGIPVFGMAWKNVVATFYHELNEARTDPDVGDARLINDPHLGWYSDGIIIPPIKKRQLGGEIGDIPIEEAQKLGRDLSTVFKEVQLSDGITTVPIQLQYSNAVHGPEGPISMPH